MTRPVEEVHEDAHEASPLLSSTTEPLPQVQTPITSPLRTQCTWHWLSVVAFCMTLAVVADIGEYLYEAPQVRLFESIICADYYQHSDPSQLYTDGPIPEHLCKVDLVQDQVATILGWQVFFDSIPAILLPIPFGYLADVYGRKWIVFLSLAGFTLTWASILFIVGVLQLPLQYVWLSSLFSIIGGGKAVAGTLVTTVVADVAPPEKRSSVFFYVSTSNLIAECITPPITAILMSRNPWIPLLIAVSLLTIVTIMTVWLPETLPVPYNGEIDRPSLIASVSISDEATLFGTITGKEISWKDRINRTTSLFAFAVRDPKVTALMFAFLVSNVGRQSMNILLQYVSKRYDWKLSEAELLMSLRAGVNIILFTMILPGIANLLSRSYASEDALVPPGDVWIARGSIILMTLGTVVLSLSISPALMIVGLVLYTLGTGFAPVLRSLVTALVETNQQVGTSDIGRLYALITLMEGVGNLIAGPGMAGAFRTGIKLGTSWLGLPFALAALLFGLLAPIVFVVKT